MHDVKDVLGNITKCMFLFATSEEKLLLMTRRHCGYVACTVTIQLPMHSTHNNYCQNYKSNMQAVNYPVSAGHIMA